MPRRVFTLKNELRSSRGARLRLSIFDFRGLPREETVPPKGTEGALAIAPPLALFIQPGVLTVETALTDLEFQYARSDNRLVLRVRCGAGTVSVSLALIGLPQQASSHGTPPLPDDVRSVSGAELVNAAYEYLEPIFRGLSPTQEDRALAALPVPLRDMWVLQWLDFEVILGGLASYFMNARDQKIQLALVDRKGRDYFRRRSAPVFHMFEGVWEDLTLDRARLIAQTLIAPFLAGEVDAIYIVYNEFKTRFRSRPELAPCPCGVCSTTFDHDSCEPLMGVKTRAAPRGPPRRRPWFSARAAFSHQAR